MITCGQGEKDPSARFEYILQHFWMTGLKRGSFSQTTTSKKKNCQLIFYPVTDGVSNPAYL
jgi:hypothetical protein